jgi:hypothetical protein
MLGVQASLVYTNRDAGKPGIYTRTKPPLTPSYPIWGPRRFLSRRLEKGFLFEAPRRFLSRRGRLDPKINDFRSCGRIKYKPTPKVPLNRSCWATWIHPGLKVHTLVFNAPLVAVNPVGK